MQIRRPEEDQKRYIADTATEMNAVSPVTCKHTSLYLFDITYIVKHRNYHLANMTQDKTQLFSMCNTKGQNRGIRQTITLTTDKCTTKQ